MRPSEWVEKHLWIENKPFRFSTPTGARNHLPFIYDQTKPFVLLKTARGCEKSTTICNKIVMNSATNPGYKTLYVNPSPQQITDFVVQQMIPRLRSPWIREHMIDRSVVDNITLKTLSNGSVIFMRNVLESPDRVRGIRAYTLCYDSNAYVLTRNGWVGVIDLTTEDEVASVNDEGVVEWHHPDYVVHQPYEGNIVRFKRQGMDLRVTEDHNMWINERVKPTAPKPDEFSFHSAKSLLESTTMGFKMTCGANWDGNPLPEKVLSGLMTRWKKPCEIRLDYKMYAELVGWFISEGSIQYTYWKGGRFPSAIVISQNENRHLSSITSIIDGLGLNYSVYSKSGSNCKSVMVFNTLIAREMEKLGKCKDKYIPREFFKYSELLEHVLIGIYLGDACYHSGENWVNGTLRTRSRRLAEDVQEAWLRLKRPAVIHTRFHSPYHQSHPLHKTATKTEMYEVCSFNKDYYIFWNSEKKKKNRISSEHSSELVHCFNVKYHRPIVKGGFGQVPVIAGNCLDEIQDLVYKHIPVLEETLFSSSNFEKQKLYAGTPKTFDNSLQVLWEKSSQNMWHCPCTHCGFADNTMDTIRQIGKKGPICIKCGGSIIPHNGFWVSHNKEKGDMINGFHFNQIMLPWAYESEEAWKQIIFKLESYGGAEFNNEVLGISFDNADKPITEAEMRICATGEFYAHPLEWHTRIPTFIGIDWGCHDVSTRVLTEEHGWVYLKNLTMSDKVAQWSENTRMMSFVHPLSITKKHWSKPLLHFKNSIMDLMTTDDHRMHYKTYSGKYGRWVTTQAEELRKRRSEVRFVGSINWDAPRVETFTIPGISGSAGYGGCEDKVVDMDDWLLFLGYYLSEGGLCRGNNGRFSCLKMSQRVTVNKEIAEKMLGIIRKLGFKHTLFPNRKTGDWNITIYGKQMWAWVRDNIGTSCSTKRIPREFANLGNEQLQILFGSMMEGDGSTDVRGPFPRGSYLSTSKGLCEDFQEIAIKLGLRCSVALKRKAIGNKRDLWGSNWSHGKDLCVSCPSKNTKLVPYDDMVYCCSVPDGYIVTERNGKVSFQGNSGNQSKTVCVIGAKVDNKLQVLHFREFPGHLYPKMDDIVDEILSIIREWNIARVASDFGFGYVQNQQLRQYIDMDKFFEFYNSASLKGLARYGATDDKYTINYVVTMTSLFLALKQQKMVLPSGPELDEYVRHFMNVHTEYSSRTRRMLYSNGPDRPDDYCHATNYMRIMSMIYYGEIDPAVGS